MDVLRRSQTLGDHQYSPIQKPFVDISNPSDKISDREHHFNIRVQSIYCNGGSCFESETSMDENVERGFILSSVRR